MVSQAFRSQHLAVIDYPTLCISRLSVIVTLATVIFVSRKSPFWLGLLHRQNYTVFVNPSEKLLGLSLAIQLVMHLE